MKKLLYLSAIGVALAGLAACESSPKNPGDFSIASELKVDRMVSLTTGASYDLKVARTSDTTYHYYYNVYDTLKDASGNMIIGPDGKPQVTTEQKFYLSKITAKLVEYEPIVFPSYEEWEFDTISLSLTSNANWLAPLPATTVSWYGNVGATTKGGGDGVFTFSVKKFANQMSKYEVDQVLYTQDSTLMYKFLFKHSGLKYTGE